MPDNAAAALQRSPKVSDDHVAIVDLPLRSLTPVQKRTAKRSVFERLESNIRAVGLIEPLLVHPYEGQHFILDGYLRYLVLQDLGVQTVPCILIPTLDAYTPNRQVNYLSMSQRWKMLKAALVVVDEERLKSALGLKELRKEFSAGERDALAHGVVAAVAKGTISKNAAIRLVHVTVERQREILRLMEQSGDRSPAFIRTQVMRTEPEQRVQHPGRKSPWNRAGEVRKKFADRLTEAESHADFFQGVYREYTRDLTVLAIHVRDLMSHREIREYLATHYPKEAKLFQQIQQSIEDA
jgi:hypothetical protein